MGLTTKLTEIATIIAFAAVCQSAKADQTELPPLQGAATAERLYRLDCGHSIANDLSVWTPGQNKGQKVEFSSTCWLIKHDKEWLLWDAGVPEAAFDDPNGWSTLPSLIVYHLDKKLTAQLADLGISPTDIGNVAISHTHGDHIGNLALFSNAAIIMQRAEYDWVFSANTTGGNVGQLVELARRLLGHPKKLQLIDGYYDLFGDGSVTLIPTPGHTPGSQALLVNLRKSGFVLLSGDVVHLESNLRNDIVPSLNTDKNASLASMALVRQIVAKYRARLFINHDKKQEDSLRLAPEFYE